VVSPRYLLDTNIVSEPYRPRPNAEVLRKLQVHQVNLAVAAPTWHELLYGCYRLPPSWKRAAVENYLWSRIHPLFPILPYDSVAAEWHAKERARLTFIGKTPPELDGQIAAIAAVNSLVLVTANVADFRHFQGLTVENWMASA
jgi:tRNA(fMet)-specific endonuclease VapC